MRADAWIARIPATLRVALVAAVLVVAAIAVYAPVRHGEFVSDDFRFIVDNQAQFARADAPLAFFTDPKSVSTPPDPDIWRPLRTWSFASESKAVGVDPSSFHAVSIAMHALATLLVFVWLCGLVGAWPAWCAALVFAVHPLCSEAVAWISSRSDLQSCVAVLLALLAARHGESKRGGIVAAAVLALLAGLAKESGVMVPALYLLDVKARTGSFLPAFARRPFVALVLGAAVYLALYLLVYGRGLHSQVGWYGGSFASHLPYALFGLATLLRLVVAPFRQNFLWEPTLFAPWSATDLALAIAACAAALGLIVWAWRRDRRVALGVLWFFVALLPASNLLLPMRTVLAERFAYVPLVGVALALAAVLARLRPSRRALVTALLVAPLAVVTWHRAAAFASPQALYEATLAAWPRSSAATMGFAELLRERGDYADAAVRFEAAAVLAAPDHKQEWRCRLAAATSRLEGGETTAAIAGFRAFLDAIQTDATLARESTDLVAEATYRLAQALGLVGRFDDSATQFEALLSANEPRAEWLDAYAELERVRPRTEFALELYARALAIDPDYHLARLHRAATYARFPAFRTQALADVREVLLRDPGNQRAKQMLQELTKSQ